MFSLQFYVAIVLVVWLSFGTKTTWKLTQRLIENIQWLRAFTNFKTLS